MVKYLLVLILYGAQGPAITSVLVETQQACEIAGTEWVKKYGANYQCIPIKAEAKQ